MTPALHTTKRPGDLVLASTGTLIVGPDGQQRRYVNPRTTGLRRSNPQ